MAAREGIVEKSGAGRLFSRWYSRSGPSIASVLGSARGGRETTRAVLVPLAAAPGATGLFCAVALLMLGVAALRRL